MKKGQATPVWDALIADRLVRKAHLESMVQRYGSVTEFGNAIKAANKDLGDIRVKVTSKNVLLNTNGHKYLLFKLYRVDTGEQVAHLFVNTGQSVSEGDDIMELEFGIFKIEDTLVPLAYYPREFTIA